MGLTQLQSLELNKRTDKILHAPSNAPAGGQQLEIAFVADVSGDIDEIHQSIQDAVASLKSHDTIFQNVRSNLIYWGNGKIILRAAPMPIIQMGRAFEGIENIVRGEDIVENIVNNKDKNVDKPPYFEDLCEYLKLYGARCRCVLLFLDETYEEFEKRHFRIKDAEKAKENLNPFLKYRLLVVAKDKMVTGSELFMKLI